MNIVKNFLIKHIWNTDAKCANLVLAPTWAHGSPYFLRIRVFSEYVRENNLADKNGCVKLTEALVSFYEPDKHFCGVIKGAYIAREAIATTEALRKFGMEEKIVPFKIALATRIAMHYDIDEMYWNMQMPFQ